MKQINGMFVLVNNTIGMLMNVVHRQVHKNIWQRSLTGFITIPLYIYGTREIWLNQYKHNFALPKQCFFLKVLTNFSVIMSYCRSFDGQETEGVINSRHF